MTLTLMRHPHIDFAAQRCIGQTDVDLSFEGKSSLKSIAGQACRLFPDLVISSDLKRCRLLAEEIAARLRRFQPAKPHYARGYGKLFLDHVTQANAGCDFDFLASGTSD